MIKLTNATKEYKDKALLINPEHIMAVFETIVDDITVTNIYSVTQQSWQVTETIDEVYSIINK
jgi:hypothetical protein